MSRAGSPTVRGPGADAVWRRLRWPLVVLLLVLAASAVIGLVGSGPPRGELDPAAADPAGSRALAMLLADRGVPVVRATGVSAALDRAGRPGTLLVPFPDRVPADQLARLAAAYSGDRLVLVGPGRRALAALRVDPMPHGTAPVARRDPDCGLPAADTAGDADLGGTVYDPAGGTGCYPAAGGSTLVVTDRADGGRLVLVGAGDLMQNRRLDRRGNAALSLLLLGVDGSARGPAERVVWLMSGPGSAATGPPSLVDIAPRWLVLGAAQLLLASLVVALWRGRRLGPPVTEPLPVVVRAAETVEGRARLYRRAGARGHAAEALRAGALARLVPRLGLGVDPAPAATAAAVSARTGAAEPGAVLFGPPPADDAGLVRLADQLDAVVTATLATPTPHRHAAVSTVEDEHH
ncbi:MAG TPA: DUF4350 domain-containing protein [Mycobacteriales bacterium]|nr:DUF4350 domain-containing protein [Mycobacteriales bacterium]